MRTYQAIDIGPHRAGMTIDASGHWLRTYHPYDLAEYHWAWSRDGRVWMIFRDHGMGANHRREQAATVASDNPAVVIFNMVELDRRHVRPLIDRS